MTTVTQQKIINGLIEDDKNINRTVASSVSQLNAQVDLMLVYAAYIFTEVSVEGSAVDSQYITDVTERFQAQLVPLLTVILPKLQEIEGLGNADPLVAQTNLQEIITKYNLSPETFANRYK